MTTKKRQELRWPAMMAVAILHQTELSSCAACGFYRNGNYEAIECQSVWQLELAHIPLIPAIWDCTCSMGLTSHVKRANSQACRRSPSRPTGPEFIRGEPSAQGYLLSH
ncbi:hypothetical protein M747DRAFT_73957 [Aspergillus niger ATCC 13496]|uniref:Uncharacterized protein n=1 Tax=Aspergillus niger ATCC 13496 TaxID=1353008 RepID=A0A370BSP1_ASPNG|nr:hypothetical protein M747DRAFT_73957 [Aspergillus niger ATCC 13496]